MRLAKILSGGKAGITGALWTPPSLGVSPAAAGARGRPAEDGRIPERYPPLSFPLPSSFRAALRKGGAVQKAYALARSPAARALPGHRG